MGYLKRWISDEFDDDLSPKEASIVLDRYMSIDRRKYTVGINKSTRKGTYSWLSRNSELINVASTRAKKSLILFSDDEK